MMETNGVRRQPGGILATVDLLMPALSPTMSEGGIARWLKREGDPIARGEIIAEIETDKSVVEFAASQAGTLERILVPAGTEGVPVNRPIATLTTAVSDALPPSAEVPAAQAEREPICASARPASTPRVAASPLARRVARQAGIDVRTLTGTGPGGRIVRADVERSGRGTEAAVRYTEIAVSSVRRTIARRMSEAKASIPHFYLTVDCRMDALLGLRAELMGSGSGQRMSVNDCIIRAAALALRKAPALNASWHERTLRCYEEAHVAVAVATSAGLMAPVIRNADQKSVWAIAQEMQVLIERARAGRLEPADYQGGNFTISNLGMHGIREFAAIINPPHAGILGVGAVEKRVIVVQDEPRIAAMMTCTLSADHRIIDGAAAAEFLAAFRMLLQEPAALMDQPGGRGPPATAR